MAKLAKPELPADAPPPPEASQVTVASIDDLALDPANLRLHDERGMAGLGASLQRFGPARSIVVDAKGVVRAGNGTVEAARRAGVRDVLVVEPRPGQLVAVRRADWSPSEATAYSVADNRLTDISTFDDAALAETLRALQSESFDLAAVGFDDGEVAELVARLASEPLMTAGQGEAVDDPQGEWQGMPEFEHEDLTAVQQIHVHFKTREDVQAFAELIGQTITENTRFLWYPEAEIGRYADKQYTDESEISGLYSDKGKVRE